MAVVGSSDVRVAGKTGVSLSAAVLVVSSQLLVLLWRLEVHLVLYLRLPLRALFDLGEFALYAWDVLGLGKRPHLGRLEDLGIGAKEIVDAHRRNLHLLLIDGRSDLHQDAILEQSAYDLCAL